MKVIKGYGAPTAETIGDVNDFYVDLDTNYAYRCTSVNVIGEEWGDVILYASGLDNTVYVWEKVGGNEEMRPYAVISNKDGVCTFYSDECTVEEFKPDEVLMNTCRNVVYNSGDIVSVMIGVYIPGNGTISMVFANPNSSQNLELLYNRKTCTISYVGGPS